jgi:hypothetical protein
VKEDADERVPCNGATNATEVDENVDNTDADEVKDGALKSRKPASRVWQFFSPRYVSSKDNRVCVKCKVCYMELSYANTTNMHNHLVRKHSTDYLQDLASGKKVSKHCCLYILFRY